MKESCISIMILKEPVKWGDFNVSLVVLLAIRETDNSLLKVFFDWLCNIVTDNNKFQELIQSSGYEEFMNHVIRVGGRKLWQNGWKPQEGPLW